MIRVFIRHGDRTDRKKARLKYLLDSWGLERFLEETEKLLAFPLIRVPVSECEPRQAIDRTAHIGVHSQSQQGLHYIGIAVPVGRLPSPQMRALAAIAQEFGTGELRLTVWQNLIIPNISSERLEAARQAIRDAGLDYQATTVLGGTIACTGSKGCRLRPLTPSHMHCSLPSTSMRGSRSLISRLISTSQAAPTLARQHYIGDIGLMGVKVSGEEGYQVLLGGGADKDQGLGRELISSIRFADLRRNLNGCLGIHSCREPAETFLHFTRRHDVGTLQSFCNEENVQPCKPFHSFPITHPLLPSSGVVERVPCWPLLHKRRRPPRPNMSNRRRSRLRLMFCNPAPPKDLRASSRRSLKSRGHVATLNSLEGYTPASLMAESYAILLARPMARARPQTQFVPSMSSFVQYFPCGQYSNYAVLALGDSNYEHFCQFGIDLDNKLASLSANRMCSRVDCDIDLDDAFAQWKTTLLARLDEIVAANHTHSALSPSVTTSAGAATPRAKALTHTRETPSSRR